MSSRWGAAVALTIVTVVAPALAQRLSGTIRIDGSSTVYPITEAVAEEFQAIVDEYVRTRYGAGSQEPGARGRKKQIPIKAANP